MSNQGFETNNHTPNAATRSLALMADELTVFGEVSPEVEAMVLDEELTHAAEVLAAQEKAYAAIPRQFEVQNNDLVDTHNQSLRAVIEGGISFSEEQVAGGVLGADWELQRRKAELKNLDKIIGLSPGSALLEISASPFDKPEEEQLAQNYNGLTMIRLSIKSQPDKVLQFNYAVPVVNPVFLQAIETKFGRERDEAVSSDTYLEEPIELEVSQSIKDFTRNIDGLVGAALLESATGYSALRMLERAIKNRREAWDFVSSSNHSDLHAELLGMMKSSALLQPTEYDQAMDAIRSGFWKEFKDRFNKRKTNVGSGGVIATAASRAVADGNVFIACGSTVNATDFSPTANSSTSVGRAEIVKDLREKVVGSGSCGACGAKGQLFGCGLCGGCNKKWCDIYEKTGNQTEISDLSYMKYGRGYDQYSESETLGQHWERIKAEVRQKQLINRQRDEEFSRLRDEKFLAEAA